VVRPSSRSGVLPEFLNRSSGAMPMFWNSIGLFGGLVMPATARLLSKYIVARTNRCLWSIRTAFSAELTALIKHSPPLRFHRQTTLLKTNVIGVTPTTRLTSGRWRRLDPIGSPQLSRLFSARDASSESLIAETALSHNIPL